VALVGGDFLLGLVAQDAEDVPMNFGGEGEQAMIGCQQVKLDRNQQFAALCPSDGIDVTPPRQFVLRGLWGRDGTCDFLFKTGRVRG